MRSIWTGTITFDHEAVGVIVAPVSLYKARDSHDISFRQIAPNGYPISQKRVDSDGNEVAYADIRKGYEVAEDTFIHVPDEALDELMPEASKNITLFGDFVDEVDPVYYENTYLVGIDKKADKIATPKRYAEMCAIVGDRIAIGTFVYRGRQHTVALRQNNGHLYLSTLYYEDEVRDAPVIPAYDIEAATKAIIRSEGRDATADDIAKAKAKWENRLIGLSRIGAALCEPLDISKYKDYYTEQVRSLIDTLAVGGTYVAPSAPMAPAMDEIDDEALLAAAEALEAARGLSAVKGADKEALV